MKEAKLYQKLEDKKVQCLLCHHFCQLADGQLGICGVRQNIQGKLMSLNYGHLITEAIDPIEKKPIFHLLPGSLSYSIATIGCNLRCDNCQNWTISQYSKLEIRNSKLELPGYDVTPEETITKAIEAGCQSIAYTYTEPTIFFEFALDCMKLARQNGLKNIWVSNGYMSKQCLDEILPYLDAINVDLKFFDEKIYLKNCGCHLPPILDNLKYLYKDSRFKTQDSKLILEITTLLIPGLTDVNNQPQKIAEFIAQELSPNVPWHISRFSPDISYKMQNGQDTPLKLINRAYELGKRAGLNYIYVGNIWNNEHESTYCPQCGALVIKRLGYQIKALTPDGHCPKCYYQLPLRII